MEDGECVEFCTTTGSDGDGADHSQAESDCVGMGARLGTIRAQAQNQAVASMVGNCSEVHNGLTIDEQSSQVAWQSGKPVIGQAHYCRLTPAAECVRLTPAGSHHRTHTSSQRSSHHRSRSPYRDSDGGVPTSDPDFSSWASEPDMGEYFHLRFGTLQRCRGKRGGKLMKKLRKKFNGKW